MIDDDELRRRFAELRRKDAKNLPPFEALTARRARARVRVLVAVVPLVAAAAVFVLWCNVAERSSSMVAAPVAVPRPRPQAPAALPLDFLLESAPASVHLDADPIEGLRP
ncbi:MAG TPA: hypothetical protein VM925_06870 [Labilithrix sp.]|nr:hypothetical protein [Labilithrix sp.]